MILSDLPSDLVEEILSRVPAMSLKRLRSTCKRWNALLKDHGFTEKHFRNAEKQSLVLKLKLDRVFKGRRFSALKASSVFLASASINASASPPSIGIEVPLSLKDSPSSSEDVDIDIDIIHCDGLLLCTTLMQADRVVVWNPCLGETRWIQTKSDYDSYSSFALGHDNNKLCKAYKVLKFDRRGDDIEVFEIYELTSHDSSWRVLDDVTVDSWSMESMNVSLKGNTYWISSGKEFLTCFDFRRERFTRLCLPTLQSRGRVCLSVVRDEQLTVLHKCYNTSKMDIWVTNKIDTEAALWTKSFTVDSNDFDKVPFEFLIVEDKKVVVYCNVGEAFNYTLDKYCSKSSYVARTQHPLIYVYVPSLVQIQAK